MDAAVGRPEADDQPGAAKYRRLSLWLDGLPGPLVARPCLLGDTEADVAVVGAGFTGLWTAYYLLRAEPSLRVVLLEAEIAGFGASGRNGGWCSALFAVSPSRLARLAGPAAAAAMRAALERTVDEVGAVAAAEGIDCSYLKGGTVVLARSAAQWERAREEVAQARRLGIGEQDLALLGPEEASRRCGASDVVGATFTPHCAALDPARLVRGLAGSAVRRGARLYEHSAVTSWSPGELATAQGRVRAAQVVLATEAWSARLPGRRRSVAPVYSLMLATEPLPDEFFDTTGLARRETFADHRHVVIYGQRTADGRLAFGGRGAPYHFGSAIEPAFDADQAVHAALETTLRELFPALAGAAVTHRWGGPIGIHRDWFPSVRYDPASGVASAGGYVGDGVAASNLAGRTLADLLLGRNSELTALAWVGHRSRRWEPEPLRFAGANALLALAAGADRAERRGGRPARRAAVLARFTGG